MKKLVISLIVGGALATGAFAQEEEADIATLLQNVTGLAGSLQGTVENLNAQIEGSANSAEEGTRVLDEMLAAANQLQDELGRESQIWVDLNALMDEWKVKRDDLLERAKTNAGLKPIAETWQQRLDQGLSLREKILDQATESAILVSQIEDKREVVLALYDAEMADQVLATMQQMSDELTAMNTSMKSILDQTNTMAGETGDVPQN